MTYLINSNNNQITFKNASGITTIILTPYTPPKPQPNDVKFNNTYKPNLTDDNDLLIKLDQNNKITLLNGCNSQSATYKAADDGSISFTAFISTRMYCQNDKDSIYTSALTNSVKYISQGDRLVLMNASGQQTLILTPYTVPVIVNPPVVTPPVVNPPVIPVKVEKVSFSGNYTASIKNDSDIVISFGISYKLSILNGCNVYNTNYTAYSNGSIIFGDFIGT